MGTRVVCVEGTMTDQLAANLRDWQVPFYGRQTADALLSPDRRFASHQLKFVSWQRAFEFRMAWC